MIFDTARSPEDRRRVREELAAFEQGQTECTATSRSDCPGARARGARVCELLDAAIADRATLKGEPMLSGGADAVHLGEMASKSPTAHQRNSADVAGAAARSFRDYG